MTWGSKLYSLTGCSLLVCAIAAPAQAKTWNFDIPEQPAASAITALGDQAEVEIIAARRITAGRQANAVRGAMDVDEALKRLLMGTDLTAQQIGPQTYTIVPRTRTSSAAPGAIVLARTSDPASFRVANAVQQPPAPETSALAEVVVTASRRDETVQRAALSIQALTAESLERANLSRPEDISKLAPGVSVASGGNYPQVFIRGVGNSATNALAEGAVAVHLDGVYISQSQTMRGMFYDLERIEVLKGPQGTLYGRNASGGAMNVITIKPKLGDRSGYVEIAGGNYDLFQATGAVNLPLGETLALRVAGQAIERAGYLSDGTDDERQRSLRAHLLWEPNQDVSLLVSAQYQHVGGKGAGAALKPRLPGDPFRGNSDPAVIAIYRAQPGLGPLFSVPNGDGYIDNDVRSIGGELNWNLGFATLTVLPAYRDSLLRDKTYVPGFPVAQENHDKQSSAEVRLGDNGETLKWVVGGYFFDERAKNRDDRPLQVVQTGVLTQIVPDFDLNTRSYAAFAQATYSMTDKLRLTGGLRYTYEKKNLKELIQVYTLPGATPPPCSGGTVFDPATPSPPRFCRRDVNGDGRLTYNNVTYKVGVEYDLAPQSMVYGNLSTGFKSGGFSQAPPPNTFRPEKLTAFEVGSKNRFLENRLQMNLEGFYWRYEDHQETASMPTSIPGYYALLIFNAGKAKSYGADFDVAYRATRVDELSFKVQFNKTNYDSFSYLSPAFAGVPVTGCVVGPLIDGSRNVDCSGKQLVRAPLWSGVVSYTHTFDLAEHGTLEATISSQFSSNFETSTDFLGATKQSAYAFGDFDMTYTPLRERWSMSAFVHNMANTAVYTQSFRFPFVDQSNPLAPSDGLINGGLQAPRTFGAKLRVNF